MLFGNHMVWFVRIIRIIFMNETVFTSPLCAILNLTPQAFGNRGLSSHNLTMPAV